MLRCDPPLPFLIFVSCVGADVCVARVCLRCGLRRPVGMPPLHAMHPRSFSVPFICNGQMCGGTHA